MAFQVCETGCCGMLELVDISTKATPADMMAAIKTGIKQFVGPQLNQHRKPFIIYTGVVDRSHGGADHASRRNDNYGQLLADYIHQHKLGTVHCDVPANKSWTGNVLKVWVWMPDYDALRAFEPVTPTIGNVLYGSIQL